MPVEQQKACIEIACQLPALVEELKKANKLKALELKIRLQNDWHSSANAAGEVDFIMEG